MQVASCSLAPVVSWHSCTRIICFASVQPALCPLSQGGPVSLQGLIQAHRAFSWEPAPFDDNRDLPQWRRGLAFNYTVEGLRRSYMYYMLERNHQATLLRDTGLSAGGDN